MSFFNAAAGYGRLTKLLHWLILALFAFQYVAASIMVRMGPAEQTLGLAQSTWYNWHKSIGLIALVIAIIRLANRRMGELPPWAPTLSDGEKRFIHRAEQVLYLAMFLMPVSGFLYVMAGGYGVHLFGRWHLPNPTGAMPTLAVTARWTHILTGWVLLATIAGHVGLVLRHQLVMKDGLLWRMWPGHRR